MAPLLVESEAEQALFKKGEANSKAKKALRTRSLLEKAPDNEESNLIHSMWTKEMSYLSKCLPLQNHTHVLTPVYRPPSARRSPRKPSLHE